MTGEEGKMILEYGALVGKAGLKRVSSEMVWMANKQERGERRERAREGERERTPHDETKLESNPVSFEVCL